MYIGKKQKPPKNVVSKGTVLLQVIADGYKADFPGLSDPTWLTKCCLDLQTAQKRGQSVIERG